MTELEIDTTVSRLHIRRSDAYLESSVEEFNSHVSRLFPVETWEYLLVYHEAGALTQNQFPISSLDLADQMAGLVAFENVLNQLREREIGIRLISAAADTVSGSSEAA